MVAFSPEFPAHVTVIFFDRSPLGHRGRHVGDCCETCARRLLAMELTLSVRSFQVPATPSPLPDRPNLPSVPTSRRPRVTSQAKALSWADHRIERFLELKDFARHVTVNVLGEFAARDCGGETSRRFVYAPARSGRAP